MRYLILSDIHGNLQALEAVLAAARGWDRLLVLGDLVGYGADPNAVIERVRSLAPAAVVRGNHDKVACGLDDGTDFNQVALLSALWTAGELTAAHREYLRGLPPGPIAIDSRLEICHGSPFDEDTYILGAADAEQAFAAMVRPLCVFGHTHLPVAFAARGDTLSADVPEKDGAALGIEEGTAYLVNPGAVGQPRDGDPRAAFGEYEPASGFTFRRVAYDVAGAQARIAAAGLPEPLAARLAAGR